MLALEQRFSYLKDKSTKKIRDFLKEFKNIKGGKCKRTFKSWKKGHKPLVLLTRVLSNDL